MTSPLPNQLRETAAGSRELDALIFVKLFGGEVRPEYYRKGLSGEEFELMTGVSPLKTEDGWEHRQAGHYTTSIDAALALIEEVLPGWDWDVSRETEGVSDRANKVWFEATLQNPEDQRAFSSASHQGHPALALCLALLSAVEGGSDV